jgi:phosphoglycerate dehydrogenase-like enzyme
MTKSQLSIFCSAHFDGEAQALLSEVTKNHQLLRDEDDFASADVAFGQPEPKQVMASTRLKWVHITSAGYTRYDTDEMRAALHEHGTIFTNSSHVFDAPCAQHVLAMMLAQARQLLPCYESQRTTHDWPSGERRKNSFLLNGQTVLLLGMGAIAEYLTRLLQPFGMRIIAVRRNPQAVDGVEVVAQNALNEVVPQADHVVNILPESPSTLRFMNAARFAQMKPGARFYNIGRGATVDQEALLDALKSGHLGFASLDVTEPEPLLPDHPLWTAPNCFITPHSAGGHQGEGLRLVQHFVHNLRAFEAGEPLADRVWK